MKRKPCSRRLVSIVSAACLPLSVLCAGDEDWCDWPREDGRTLTQEQFDTRYFEKGPVVLTHLIEEWPAHSEGRWDHDKVLEQYGSFQFNSTHLAPNCRILSEVRDGTLLKNQLNSGLPASWFVYPHHPMVADMATKKDFLVPKVLRAVTATGPCISIGHKDQGNIAHDHETNWLAQVRGRKRWLVRPPGWDDGPDKFPGISRAGRMREGPCKPPPPWPDMRHCVVKAGEIAYLPSQWMHETCGLDDFNIGVAYIGSAPANVRKDPKKMDAWMSATDGNLPALKKQVYQQEKKKSKERIEKSVLMSPALTKGHVSVVDWLIRNRADASSVEAKGKDLAVQSKTPPLHQAAHAGHVDLLPMLVKHGAELTQKDKNGLMPAHWAAIHGHVPILEYLSPSGAANLVHKDSGTHSIHFAAANGHAGGVEYMLSQGESANQISGDGSRPIHSALRDGHTVVAETLLKHRADISAMDAEGQMPVHQATGGAFAENLLSSLVEHGVDLAAFNGKGQAPAHMAAQYGQTDILRFLAQRKVDFSAPDKDGTPPMFWAAQGGHAEVIEYLAKQGLDVDAPIPSGFRPLIVAAGEGHISVIEQLLAARADPDVRSMGKTAAEWAEQGGHSKVVEFLAPGSSAGSGSSSKRRRKRRRRKAASKEL